MGKSLSDSNTTRSNVSQRKIYSDLPLSLSIHPVTQDLTALNDIDAVKQSVKNLVVTNFTERLFAPQLGSNITGLLFEPADLYTALTIKDEVKRVLSEHEPRVNNVFVQVEDESDRNAYLISISFNVIFSDQRVDTNFYLERTR